ncbi:MAG TPA: ribonuclease J, partial [Thermopetrobacter sp.]|nr:ribonuclease J [Thermopetrobacter sp.]
MTDAPMTDAMPHPRRPAADDRDFVVLPLGGAGEIGMNLYLYGYGRGDRREWVMVDCGVMFGDEKTPGVELVLPDVAFIEERREDLLGILVTHAHEDHIGAIPWIAHRLRVPVYATRFAAILIRHKLEETGWEDEVEIVEVRSGERLQLGEIGVEYVPVTHSLPEPNALVLRTPAGTVVHSGDFKIDRHPVIPPAFSFDRLREIGEEGVAALVCDSTNAAREGRSPSESEVARELEKIIAEAPARVAVTTFSSHVGRIRTVAEAARRHGREVVVAGYAMKRVTDAARQVGLLDGELRFHEEEDFGFLPPEKVVLL